ncbi:unnamed protein product [Camellia sinensis]
MLECIIPCLRNLFPESCMMNLQAAFAAGHALLTIRQPWILISTTTVALLHTLSPRHAVPQALCHASQNRHASRAAGLKPVENAVLALAAVRWVGLSRRIQHRRHHDQ